MFRSATRLAAIAALAVAFGAGHARAADGDGLDAARRIVNQDRPAHTQDQRPVVHVDAQHGQASVETHSGVGVYGSAGGSPPTHDNPRGERHVGAGVVIRFGSDDHH